MIRFSVRPPSVSVVMPVYNGAKYLEEAINSILTQTFLDFEFIIVDDGSTDQTIDVINRFKNRKIVLHQNPINIGNYASRNIGMKMARGRYVCVMDADDVAFPMRLKRQFEHMESNPDVGICGSFIQQIPSGSVPDFLTNEALLKVSFLSNNYCSHPSLILRKDLLTRFNLSYNENYYYSADFDLCARGFRYFRVQNIPDVLLLYRQHANQISSARFAEQQNYADAIRIGQLMTNLGITRNEIPVELHLKLMKHQPIRAGEKQMLDDWLQYILLKNSDCMYYEVNALNGFLKQLSSFCLNSGMGNMNV